MFIINIVSVKQIHTVPNIMKLSTISCCFERVNTKYLRVKLFIKLKSIELVIGLYDSL